jgi:hypothetical protein
MTASADQRSEDLAVRCPQCGAAGEFGYRDLRGTMRWFCERHRLASFWADARRINNNAHPQADGAANEPAPADVSQSANGPPWDPPRPDLDRSGLVSRPAGAHRRLMPVSLDRTPRLDAAGRFLHPCFKCGRDAFIGVGVNLRAGQLGTWYCAGCKPTAGQP